MARIPASAGMMLLLGIVSAVDRPEVIDLPIGFTPEGIAIGHPWEAYVGSILQGSIWKGNLKTGEGEVVLDGSGLGLLAGGLDYDKRTDYLYVSGLLSGTGRIYDRDFNLVLNVELDVNGGALINDVVVADEFAYFTDSNKTQFYSVPLKPNGELLNGNATVATAIPLGPGFDFIEGAFNANGIVVSDDGSKLIIANSASSALYLVDSITGDASRIDLGTNSFPADGLLRRRNTLWATSNGVVDPISDSGSGLVSDGVLEGPQAVFEVSLSADWTCGAVAERTLTSELFDIPTTIARQYNGIYVVNARLFAENFTTTEYQIVRVDRNGGEAGCAA